MMASHSATLLARRRAAARRLADATELLRGSLIERLTQCGKPGCKCMRGEKHGPAYYVTVSYGARKTRQVYGPKSHTALVQRWIRNYQAAWEALEEISRINLELLRRKDRALRV